MQVRQEFQIIVFPKVFSILNFYSKGLYSLEVSLTAENQQTGMIIKGFPYIIEGVDTVKNEQKKAKINIKQNILTYTSQNFYVTFSSQNFYFHAMPYFKIELERHKKYKIWIQFNLILTSYRITKNKDQNMKDVSKSNASYLKLSSIDQKLSFVDTKKLFLNSLKDINGFKRIMFCQADYFSYTDVYLFCMKTETKIRPYQFNLHEFSLSSIQERAKLHLIKSQNLSRLMMSIRWGLMAEFNWLFKQNLITFYKYMIQQPIKHYKQLAYVYKHFRAMMMTLNNSTIIEQIKIPFLQCIGKSIVQTKQAAEEADLKYLIQDYYQTQNQAQIYVEIINQSENISKNTKWLFHNLCKLLIKINYNVFQLLSQPTIRQQWESKQSKFIFHGDISKQKNRKHAQFLKFRRQFCAKENIFQDADIKHPFIMLQGYEEDYNQKSIWKQGIPSYVIDNLVVFVHGYQGSDFDLQTAKYNLQLYNTHSYCLMSSAIQDDMDQSIQYLGQQLATQIRDHITHSYNSYKRINFVGYSLGGIIIRQSMRHLIQYKDKMNLFMSLASPHTGTIDGGNILIKTGIWYLINFQNAKNIKQLHCQFQGKQQQNFVLKKLSQCDSLQWFTKFIVISSEQDSFVPYSSSRLDEIASSTVTKLMCQNIKKKIKKLERVQVWFDFEQQIGTIDKMLGRKAHIQFLQNKVFLHWLFKLYAKQF